MDNPTQHPGSMPHAATGPSARTVDGEEISLVDVMLILARRKKLLFGLPLLAAVLAAGISLALPNEYMATTKLLPPQQAQSGASALLAQLGGAAGLAGSVAGVKGAGDLYVGILKSRTVADRLIARFDLKKRYDTTSTEIARRRLADSTIVASGKDGMIIIGVEGKDKALVTNLANGYADELQLLTKTLAVTEAAQRRLFFERQLESSKNNLAKVEVALKGAMDSGGVISVDSESRAILETAARLKAQVSAKEIQIGSMRAFVTAQNPDFQRATQELSSLRSELARLEGGRDNAGPTPTGRGGLENIQLMRDLKYYQMLYELLAKQYEAARLDEAKDSSVIQVLDPAIEPEFKSKPKRSLIVLAALLLTFVAALAWVLLSAARQRAMQTPEQAARWKELQAALSFR